MIDFSALASALVGGIIGGFATLLVGRQLAKETVTDKRRVEGVRTLLKASLIKSDFINGIAHIEQSIAKANEGPIASSPDWMKVQPLAATYNPITIEADDLIVFIDARAEKIVEGLIEASMRHQSFCDAMNTFFRMQAEIRRSLPSKERADGVFEVSANDIPAQTKGEIAQISSLLASMRETLPAQLKAIQNIVAVMRPTLKRHFGSFPEVS